jgi:type VI secretion system protein ImpM
MPRDVLAASTAMRATAPAIGWYGKTPLTGDFVSRRLSRAIIDKLDMWLQAGMTAIQHEAPDVWQEYYESAPIWDAVLPSGIVTSSVCLAIVAASFDRVGRRFPFCLIVALPGHAALARFSSLPDYCAGLSSLVDESIRKSIGADELDRKLATLTSQYVRDDVSEVQEVSDITAVLGNPAPGDELTTVPLNADSLFPWPDLVRTFDPADSTSYWWSSVERVRRHCGLTHSGGLDARLFRTLFGAAIKAAERIPPAG